MDHKAGDICWLDGVVIGPIAPSTRRQRQLLCFYCLVVSCALVLGDPFYLPHMLACFKKLLAIVS